MACVAALIEPGPSDWAALAKAAGTSQALQSVKARHDAGQACAARISGEAQGLVVLWTETHGLGKELVLGLGVGTGARAWAQWVKAFARANRCRTIRTHVRRPGLRRIYERAGFEAMGRDSEGYTVMRYHHGWQQ